MLSSCGANGIATISGCFFPLISAIIFWALTLAGSVAVILVVIGGIRLITSDGDPKKIDQSRKTITFAIAGLLLAFFSFLIINFIGSVTGVSCISKISNSIIPTFRSCQ